MARQNLTHRGSPRSNPPEDIRGGEERKHLRTLFPTENLSTTFSHNFTTSPGEMCSWLHPQMGDRGPGDAGAPRSKGTDLSPGRPWGHRPQMVTIDGGELGEEKTKRVELEWRDVVDGNGADGEAGGQVDLSRGQQPGRMGMTHSLRSMQQTSASPSPDVQHLTLPRCAASAVPFWTPPSAVHEEKSPVARRKHVEDFLFLSRVLERRMGRFSSSVGDSGCSSSDSTTLASPFCFESARRWQRPISR